MWASKAGDPRVTPIGGFLRRTRLDELPQLWNVLERRHELRRPAARAPGVRRRADAADSVLRPAPRRRPGLTGWAQVRYTYGASVEDALQKLQYDLFYIKNLSIALDLFIIFETVKTVVLRRGRVTMAAPRRPDDADRQRDERRRRGLLPRQRVRRRRAARARGTTMESRVVANTERLLDLFDEFGVRAHVLRARLGGRAASGAGARASPARGHEVASHGYAHRLDLRPDARRRFATTCAAPSDCSRTPAGARVVGYRAPSYSITPRSLWALDVLIEEGYAYDASIFPIRHDRYGIPGVAAAAVRASSATAGSLIEVPASTTRVGPMNLPVAGGGYFRLLPYCVDAVGHRAPQPARSSGRPSSTCIPGKSIRSSRGCPPAGSAGSVTTATSTRPRRGCGSC